MKVAIACISAGRPNNVARVHEQVGKCWWYVPASQLSQYAAAGAKVVPVAGRLPMKALQLNQALTELSKDHDAIATVDDDIVKVLDRTSRKPITVIQAVDCIAAALLASKFKLAGPYSGTNTKWSPGISSYGRIPGALMVHLPSPLRFDNRIIGAEDLDYCVKHHLAYGGVLLYGECCLENEWSTNEGGYQSYRSEANIRSTTSLLAAKWEKYGATFKVKPESKNLVQYKVPWKKLTLEKYRASITSLA